MNDRTIKLIYDGQCPFCDRYCRLVRIRETVGELALIDARESSEEMDRVTRLGLDIDQGMVLMVGDEVYYGTDAMRVLARMSSRSGLFNRLNYWLFRSRLMARVLYPALRACRNFLLKLLGRSKINNLGLSDNAFF
ncbi:MAG TPA: DCC1-like thiol-disulfide oxidoreductase family protein [Gammaproteobacteria bacterium]|nr:DCC1-like thiol-disulfide oxidoreductase family protein [Gammaproteobacteria bacterium]